LVEWARIKQASESFHPSEIELNQYVEKVFDLLKETASLNTVSLFHNIEFNNTLYADGKMLLSIIQNILSNAIRHTHPGGKIKVTAKKVDGNMIVQVEDNGDGMTDEIQEKLFKPQLKTLVKQRNADEGAGIGLLLVKSLLEKNGGAIWVESKAGIGSTFYFSLPLSKA
jgi:two-component system CheB/CheR fusion protein